MMKYTTYLYNNCIDLDDISENEMIINVMKRNGSLVL